MVENGFTPIFNWRDKMHGRTTFENIPHEAVSFNKENLHVWKVYDYQENDITFNWMTAKLVDNHYTNHIPLRNIKNVVKHLQIK